MVQWKVGFEEYLRGPFCAVTRYYEGESDEEFRRLERQQASAHERVSGRPVATRVLMLAGFKAMLAGDGWKNVYWGDDESFQWEEEPEFLYEVLSIITKELEASLPADALPEGLTVEVVLGGGVLNAPLDQPPQGTTRKHIELVTSSTERDVIDHLLPAALSKTDLVAYMRYCPVVLSARTRIPDKVDQNNPTVPLAYYSDGQFVWSAETVAYVDRYGAGLPEQFLQHVATHVSQHGNTPPDVPAELLHEATEMLKGGEHR